MKILYGIQGTGNGHLSRGEFIYALLKTYSKKIGEIKQKHGLSVFLKGREEKILQRLKSNSKTLEYWEIDIIYNSIFKSSKSIQNNN